MSSKNRTTQLLLRIELAGNKLPHPTLLFIYLCAAVLLISTLASYAGLNAIHPVTKLPIYSINLLSVEGLHRILTQTVTNFTHFAPVGTVLIAIMGIGIAEHTGLLSAALRASIVKAPQSFLSFIIVLAGVLSSLAADTGYVVLIPLAAIIYSSAGRHPIVGIAAAFAGVSGGYSANLLIGPLDALLAGISTESIALLDKEYTVNAAGNYYFMVASTLLISLIGTWVTEKIIAPKFGEYLASSDQSAISTALSSHEIRGLKAVAYFSVFFIALLCWGLFPEQGILRNPIDGSILTSPFIKGIVTIIAVYAAIAGTLYGKISLTINDNSALIVGMEKSMATMASYLVLMFFAAQFISYFSWSQLGIIFAIKGAGTLQSLHLSSSLLLIGFVFLAAAVNLVLGSASAKWALMAPIFVPMLFLSGISPETTQLAFRIGDSSTNIITPLMPYFGVVMAFIQRYDKSAGIGTIIATMLPYSIALLVSWILLLLVWISFNWPIGPGAQLFLH